MIAHYTAEIFKAFLYGAAGLIGGGFLFESGQRYVKTAGSNQFKGKVEALPFFAGMLIFGWGLQQLESVIADIVYAVPSMTRLGAMTIGTMLLFNYSVDYFNYTDLKSISVYAIGAVFIVAA